MKTQAFKLGEENPHYFGNVPSKKRWHYPTNFDNILFVVTKKITSLNCNVPWNIMISLTNLSSKLKIIHAMLLFPTNEIQIKFKETIQEIKD